MKASILAKLDNLDERYQEVAALLSDSETIADQNRFRELSKEYAELEPVVKAYIDYRDVINNLQEAKLLLKDSDPDMRAMAQDELAQAEAQREPLELDLQRLLLPKDPNDEKNVFLEIRAGTGGDEAGLFASDLMRMYSRYAENNNLKVKIMDIHETGVGGLKSATFSIEGPKAYGVYKYEGGVHRVQRIPKTESGGRVHTSAATVAVLPEAETAEVEINDSDIKIDTYRASGAGGQHVNKTESAIRLTHIPTGLVVTCQDESSQHKNKASAMKVLRSRLFALEQEKLNKDRDEMRKSLVSTGDRSAKIRTYNFPQGRITDHRINYTTHKLQVTLEGELDHLIEQLKLAEDSAKIE